MLQTMLLRSMKQAIYDPENRGHFGLALQSMPTSPRRFAAILTFRCIAQSSIYWRKAGT